MLSEVWGEITYPFPNFNDATVEIWELISYFNWYFIGILLLIHDDKVNPC